MKNITVLLVFTMSFIACKTSSGLPTGPDSPEPIQSNIYLFDTSNDFYKPGDILTRDKKTGGLDKLTNIKEAEVKSGNAVMRDYALSKDVKFNGLLNFLGLDNFPVTVKPRVLRDSRIQLVFSSDSVQQTYLNDLLSLKSQIKNLNNEISGAAEIFNIDLGKRDIILITNIYSSKNIEYTVDASRLKNDSLKLGFKKIAEIESNYRLKDSSNLSLKIMKEKPFGFAYKKINMGVKSGANGKELYLKN